MIERLVAVGATLLSILAVGSWLTSTAKGGEFSCHDRVLADHVRPLKKMPPGRLPGDTLSFAPEGVVLSPPRPVIAKGEPVAYILALAGSLSPGGRTLRPESVDRFGRLIGVSKERSWRLRRIQTPERWFAFPAGPGFYRVAASIHMLGGQDQTLAKFQRFVRVLPKRQMLRVEIRGDKTFWPGETVAARIENRGTSEALLSTGSGLTTEGLEDGRWTKIEAAEPPSVLFEDPEFLPAGRASRCSFFTIPTESAATAFRFSAVVQSGTGKQRTISKQFVVSSVPPQRFNPHHSTFAVKKSRMLRKCCPRLRPTNSRQDGALIARWASEHYPDSYAGIYMEGSASDRFRVGFTHHQGARIRSIKELPGLVTPGRVHRFPYVPRYSMEELRDLEQVAVDDLLLGDAYPGFAISVGLIVQRNIVLLGSEHVKRARKLLSKLYGRDAPIQARYEKPPVEV